MADGMQHRDFDAGLWHLQALRATCLAGGRKPRLLPLPSSARPAARQTLGCKAAATLVCAACLAAFDDPT